MTTTYVEQPLFDDVTDLDFKVRASDSRTSTLAAAAMSSSQEESLKDTLVRILRRIGASTYDQVFAAYRAQGGTRTEQRVRTAMAEMARTTNPRSGRPVEQRIRPAEGALGTSAHGHDAQKWEVMP